MRYLFIWLLSLPFSLWGQEAEFPFLLAPNLGYDVFIPSQYQQYGGFDGPRIGCVFYSYTEDFEGKNRPAQQAYSLHFSFLRSSKIPQERLFVFSLGGRFSFESHFDRKYLLPYYGLEAGGLKRSPKKMALHISPLLGLELWHHRSFALYAQAKYLQAMSIDSKTQSGLHLEVGAYIKIIYYQPINFKLEIL
ncbi:hypothetical protein PPO43_06465 [Saprospira sp. CCB-QB6]|uniref:hypothetical protein n=1 Tax=Saprospira sp. CCB-QB6 TaxID=3023936 RepID=UPI00234AC002|nr:hypothetical protein [Saprospira sp. CCB-QB6]WCL82734.1 hypothetical protein PPO43_06465 [Saprospira sp. CCB-QB6]